MNVCLDACFLIGLYDSGDQHHLRSQKLFDQLFGNKGINVGLIVWPALYETVSTRLVKSRTRMTGVDASWSKLVAAGQLEFVDDTPYRQEALDACFAEVHRRVGSYRPLSFTDRVLRGVLEDVNVRVDGIVTYNQGDFSDVCKKTKRILVS